MGTLPETEHVLNTYLWNELHLLVLWLLICSKMLDRICGLLGFLEHENGVLWCSVVPFKRKYLSWYIFTYIWLKKFSLFCVCVCVWLPVQPTDSLSFLVHSVIWEVMGVKIFSFPEKKVLFNYHQLLNYLQLGLHIFSSIYYYTAWKYQSTK